MNTDILYNFTEKFAKEYNGSIRVLETISAGIPNCSCGEETALIILEKSRISVVCPDPVCGLDGESLSCPGTLTKEQIPNAIRKELMDDFITLRLGAV